MITNSAAYKIILRTVFANQLCEFARTVHVLLNAQCTPNMHEDIQNIFFVFLSFSLSRCLALYMLHDKQQVFILNNQSTIGIFTLSEYKVYFMVFRISSEIGFIFQWFYFVDKHVGYCMHIFDSFKCTSIHINYMHINSM